MYLILLFISLIFIVIYGHTNLFSCFLDFFQKKMGRTTEKNKKIKNCFDKYTADQGNSTEQHLTTDFDTFLVKFSVVLSTFP